MMSLQAGLFKGDPWLEACLIQHSAHITLGATGEHVRKIQMALSLLDDLQMDSNELATNTYGRSTAAAVLAFKKKRSIINWSYETQVDNIVGKMTMAALDKEMLQWEKNSTFIVQSCACPRLEKHLPGMQA